MAHADTWVMANQLELTQNSRPLSIRLIAGRNQFKDYVLIVTKQGGLVLNKKVEGSSQN